MTALRSYIAGTGASTALVGAAVVSFALLTALVAFDGFPIGTGAAGADTVTLTRVRGNPTDVVATPGAVGVAGAAGAVAAAPVPTGPVLVASTTTTGPGGGNSSPPAVTPSGQPVPGPGQSTEPVPPGVIPTSGRTPAIDAGNPVQNAVGGLDQTINNATGIDSSLGAVTKPVTDIVDQTLVNLTGHDLSETVDSLHLANPLNGQPLVGEQGSGLLGTGLLPNERPAPTSGTP